MKKIVMMVLVLVAVVAGCSMEAAKWNDQQASGTGGTAGTGGTGGSGGTGGTACEPNVMHSCACPGGNVGTQQCYADGTGYTPCVCDGTGGTGGNNQRCDPQKPYDCGDKCPSGIGTKWCWADGTNWGECQCENVPGEYCRDADGDTYGDPANCTNASTPPAGYVGNKGDCNDGNPTVNPSKYESCNGIDDNCDDQVDEGGVCGTGGTGGAPPTYYYYYPDNDHDGHGAQGSASTASTSSAPPYGWSATNDDCDDNNASVWNTCGTGGSGGSGGTGGTGGSGGGTDCGSFNCGNDPCGQWGPAHCACLMWNAPKKVIQVEFHVNADNSHATLFGGIVRGNAGDDSKITETEWCSYSTFIPNGNIQGSGTRVVDVTVPVGDFAMFWNVWETTVSNTNRYACTNWNNAANQWFESDEYARINGHKEETVLEQYENGINNGNNCFSKSGTDY